jgi:hypothetical protein
VNNMSAMNLATQKRLGRLPKTEDTLSYKGHTYGNTHRGFGMRTPTPTSKGFFGVHGFGSAAGDGKLHYFGNGPGQADLPADGFYGLGNSAMMSQAADMLIADPTENQPTNPAGIYGLMDGGNPQLGAILVLGALAGVGTKKVDKKMGAVVGLLGAYIMTSNLKSF